MTLESCVHHGYLVPHRTETVEIIKRTKGDKEIHTVREVTQLRCTVCKKTIDAKQFYS